MRKQIGVVGLGKMGKSIADRFASKGWQVVSYDINCKGTAKTIEQLVASLSNPRIIWVMVPAGRPVDEVLFQLAGVLRKGDLVIDGGNSFFENSQKRAKTLARKGISFLDVGVSGGPASVRQGKAALMAGGEKKAFRRAEPLFRVLTGKESIGYMGESGAGHFVKMVHNGIEYGMMQAMGEGFTLLRKSPFSLDLEQVARVYNNGSVIQSRLTEWLLKGFARYGQELKGVTGKVEYGGEGKWTAETAKKLKIPVPVIRGSFRFRVESSKKPSYTGKVLQLLRHMFGGHDINPKKKS